jgi:hypothetical protein
MLFDALRTTLRISKFILRAVPRGARMGQLTHDQIAGRDMTRDFVRTEITPCAAEWNRVATVPLDTVVKMVRPRRVR